MIADANEPWYGCVAPLVSGEIAVRYCISKGESHVVGEYVTEGKILT